MGGHIPEGVPAVGTPCNVLREIGNRDHAFYSHRDERIDREELKDICEAKKDLPKFKA